MTNAVLDGWMVEAYRGWLEFREELAGKPRWERFLWYLEAPFTALRIMTVPMTAEDHLHPPKLMAALIGSVAWLSYYLAGKDINPYPWFLFHLVLCGGAAAYVYAAYATQGPLPKSFAALVGMYGFFVAATFIDTFADAVVSLLHFFGLLLGVNKAILGLTVLAWGNSIGDLSTNMAMARKGFANMAITACFAGPMFNMLVGLSLGFLGLIRKETGKIPSALVDGGYPVELSTGLLTGFVILVANCCLLIGFGVGNKNAVPAWYGYVSFAMYGCYLVVSFILLLT